MALPAAPSELRVPEYFSPSSLGSSDPCGLKVLASAQENRDAFERLPVNPNAAIGTLVHRGLELCSTGELPNPTKWLDDKLDEPTNLAAPYHCLREAVPDRKIQIVRQTFDWRTRSQEAGRSWEAQRAIDEHASGIRHFGPEVWLSSRTLRLKGKRISSVGPRTGPSRSWTLRREVCLGRTVRLRINTYWSFRHTH